MDEVKDDMQRRAKYIKAACLMVIAALILLAAPQTLHAAAILKEKSRGSEVTILQKKLSALHYKISNIDGIFGPETKRAVLLFQRDKKIKMTGIVDAKTWKELNRAKPKKAKASPPATQPAYPITKVKAPKTRPSLSSKTQIPAILSTAKTYVGVPYKFGGTTPKGFDCSGYIQYVFAKHQVSLPRSADDQFKVGKNVNAKNLEVGDLVFFSTYEKGASHCGIYAGNGKFIHVSTSKGVRIDELKDAYWKPKYLGAKRLVK